MNEFGAALAAADEVVLTDIYAASEEPIPGVTIEALAAAVNKGRSTPVHVVPKLEDVAAPRRGPRAARRSRDHARRRIDRRPGDRAGRRAASSGMERQLMAAVFARALGRPAVATDKRFRRAHVKPSRKRSPRVEARVAGGAAARARARCSATPAIAASR